MQRIDLILKTSVYNEYSEWDLHSIDYQPNDFGITVYLRLMDKSKNILYHTIDENGDYTNGTIFR